MVNDRGEANDQRRRGLIVNGLDICQGGQKLPLSLKLRRSLIVNDQLRRSLKSKSHLKRFSKCD